MILKHTIKQNESNGQVPTFSKKFLRTAIRPNRRGRKQACHFPEKNFLTFLEQITQILQANFRLKNI